MRQDVLVTDAYGNVTLDISKAVGKGYSRGWFTNCKCRYRFFVGARNTKKSKVIIGYESIMKIISDERRNILICRQNDVDNRQTSFENICSCIYDLGFEKYFHITKMPLEITYKPTGQKIIFRGLNNPTSLNSLTFAKGFLTDVYIEEAFEIQSYEDFRKLDGSLRSKLPKGLFLQITCCMNAWAQDHWIYHEFFKDRLEDDFEYLKTHDYADFKDENFIGPYGKGVYLHKSTYKINEFRDTEVYDAAADEMLRKAPEIYKVEFLGMWGNATSATYPEFNETCQVDIQQIFSDYSFADYAIGIDTGFSNGEGSRRKVLKGQNVDNRVKAATTMQLVGVTHGYDKIVVVDEYFHSNDKAYNRVNTDNQESLTSPQLAVILINTIRNWILKYRDGDGKKRGSVLMTGQVPVYVDCADIGFRQVLEVEAKKQGIFNVVFMGSTKLPIQSRVDYTRLLMAYGDFVVCKTNCPNLIREIKNSRRGDKGEARADSDDHAINACEYANAPLWMEMSQWKNFKVH